MNQYKQPVGSVHQFSHPSRDCGSVLGWA